MFDKTDLYEYIYFGHVISNIKKGGEMKTAVLLLLCLALAASATTRIIEGSGSNEPASTRGTYTVLDMWDPSTPGSTYGLALKDDVANSLWLCCWGDAHVYEYDMSTSSATGNNFEITNGIDADDMCFCEYTSGNQFFIGDWVFSNIGVFDDSGVWVKALDGPASFSNVYPIAAGHDMLYADRHGEIAWGSYTGIETSVTWTVVASPITACYGMAAWGDYVFACCGNESEDNIFIFHINADGSLDLTPVWSCEFAEVAGGANGGIDFDGTDLWVYPQNDMVYKLDIDWDPSSLENATWGHIKADF